ncbi:MAG: TolC family protein [Tannerella sp.]|jgi:outer membrane protein TolC|nr:TolC family protein [Tannerella sp.]
MKRLSFFTVFVTACFSMQAQLSLDECRLLARENYPLIKQYGLIEQSTEYSVANAAKAHLPQVSFAVQATWQSDVATFPKQMTDIYEQFGMEMKGLHKDQYKVALEVNQTVWDGGLTRAQQDISRAEGEVSARSVEAELYALHERINQLYFGLLILEEQLQQNGLLQELLQSNHHTVESCVKNGAAVQGDLNVIKAEQLSVLQQRVQIESSATAYRQMLSFMTGRKIDGSATFEKPAVTAGNLPVANPQGGMGAFTDEGNNRPELRLFEARTAQFEARKRAVKASVMPRFGLFAQGYYGNPGLNLFKDMTEDQWSWNYMAGLRLQWNFGSFYTKKGDMQKLSLAQRQVDSQRETFLFNNSLQQIRQRSAIEKMRKMMANDDEIIKLRTSIRRSSEAKYANGTVTVSDLLRDITTESQALLNKSIHELEWLKNIYELKNTVNF